MAIDKPLSEPEVRKWLKDKSIKLAAKPLGRPSAKAVENHVRPGERNPIEGKFGQAKNAYRMNRIRARLKHTSQSWIASIILVLNLVKLAGMALACLGFSAWKRPNLAFHSALSVILTVFKTKNQSQRESGLVLLINVD